MNHIFCASKSVAKGYASESDGSGRAKTDTKWLFFGLERTARRRAKRGGSPKNVSFLIATSLIYIAYSARLLNHEVGHVFGLIHDFENTNVAPYWGDGCEDTPHHYNCWSITDNTPINCFNNLSATKRANSVDLYTCLQLRQYAYYATSPAPQERTYYTTNSKKLLIDFRKRTNCKCSH